MKTIKLATIIALLMMIFGTPALRAEEADKPAASADMAFLSKYVWRGYEFSKDSLILQPSVTVGYKNFSLNLWGNIDTDVDNEDTKDFNEIDMTMAYDYSFDMLSVGIGYIYYGLEGADSEELYVSFSLDTLLAPSLTIYRDITQFPGWYINAGVSHSFDVSDKVTLDLAGSIGYYSSDDDDFVEYDGDLNPTTDKYKNFHDCLLSAGLTIPFAEYFTFSPMLAYSLPISSEADDHIAGSSGFSNDSDYFYGGGTLSISF